MIFLMGTVAAIMFALKMDAWRMELRILLLVIPAFLYHITEKTWGFKHELVRFENDHLSMGMFGNPLHKDDVQWVFFTDLPNKKEGTSVYVLNKNGQVHQQHLAKLDHDTVFAFFQDKFDDAKLSRNTALSITNDEANLCHAEAFELKWVDVSKYERIGYLAFILVHSIVVATLQSKDIPIPWWLWMGFIVLLILFDIAIKTYRNQATPKDTWFAFDGETIIIRGQSTSTHQLSHIKAIIFERHFFGGGTMTIVSLDGRSNTKPLSQKQYNQATQELPAKLPQLRFIGLPSNK